jgi:serine/threonine protein kinase
MTTFLGSGSVGNVFRGHFGDMLTDDFVAKVAMHEPSQALLRHEAKMYTILSALQGAVIPMVYGLFIGQNVHVLVMRYAGEAISSFSKLSIQQRYVVTILLGGHIIHVVLPVWFTFRYDLWTMIQSIHAAGVSHQDLRPDNIGLSMTGNVQILDFSHAILHDCMGISKCAELQTARQVLDIAHSQSL